MNVKDSKVFTDEREAGGIEASVGGTTMRKVTIMLDERYDRVLSVTAVGGPYGSVNVATGAYDLNKGTCIVVCKDGTISQHKEE